MRLPLRSLAMAAAVAALELTPHSAAAETDTNDPDCQVTDVQYSVSANLQITDTTMGAGNGTHQVGPGKIVLRFDNRHDHPRVKLLAYDLRQSFTVVAKALMWTTKVTTDIEMRVPFLGSSAEGTLDAHTLRWGGQAGGVRSDGTLTCEGTMCGKFGAPPAGSSEVHTGPTSIELKPFQFGADMKTFTMPFALVSESESPKQKTLMSIAGREVRRACVTAAAE
jgi:hypothetical protein